MLLTSVCAKPVLIFPNEKFFIDHNEKSQIPNVQLEDTSIDDTNFEFNRGRRQAVYDPFTVDYKYSSGYKNAYDRYYTNRNNFFYNALYRNENYYSNHKLFVPNLIG